jgi:hypothetical protein
MVASSNALRTGLPLCAVKSFQSSRVNAFKKFVEPFELTKIATVRYWAASHVALLAKDHSEQTTRTIRA